MERYFTAAEVADLLRVHIVTIRIWLRAGKLRGIALSDKSGYRIAQSDLEAFIAARTAKTMKVVEAVKAA